MFHVEQCLNGGNQVSGANCSTWNRDSSRHLQGIRIFPRETFYPRGVGPIVPRGTWIWGETPMVANQGSFLGKWRKPLTFRAMR
jgi:hypothetical protein